VAASHASEAPALVATGSTCGCTNAHPLDSTAPRVAVCNASTHGEIWHRCLHRSHHLCLTFDTSPGMDLNHDIAPGDVQTTCFNDGMHHAHTGSELEP
jgi:hypothetical protein